MRLIKLFWILFCLAGIGAGLWGEVEYPESLVVGLARFGGNIPPEYEYLMESLPMEIHDLIKSCSVHTLSPEEKDAFAERSYLISEEAIKTRINTYREERDNLFFSDGKTGDKYLELTEKIDSEIQKLGLVVKEIPDSEEKTVDIEFSEKNETGELLSPVAGDPANRKKDGLDYLVWGNIEEIDGLIYLYWEIYSFVLDKSVFERETVFLTEDADSVISRDRDEIWSLFHGKEWSRLVVKSIPETGVIFLDKGEGSTGRLESGFISPGKHNLKISAYGFRALEETVELSDREETITEYSLVPLERKRVPVVSFPQGADVFLGSRWMGTTPITVYPEGEFSRILLRKEGYEDYSYYLSGDRPGDVNVVLKESVFDWDSYVVSKRDNFYRSLGSFFLSIPVTVLFYSGYTIFSNAFHAENSGGEVSDDMERLYDLGNGAYYGYMGSLFINSVLFFDLIFNAVDYVKTAGQKFKE